MGDKIRQNGHPEVLVIAATSFHEALAPWLAERRAQYDVAIVDPTVIDAAYPVLERPAAIRQYVRDTYAAGHGRLRFLQLVGDDQGTNAPEDLPIGRTPQGAGVTATPPSDDYYANVDDDPAVELAVGRFSVQTAQQLQAIVRKTMAYAARPITAAPLTFYAGLGKFGTVEDLLIEAFFYATLQQIPTQQPIDLEYEAEDSAFHHQRSIGAMLAQGALIFTYVGHGAPHVLGTKDRFGTKDLAALTIAGMPPILNLLACSAGCFAQQDCLGEQLAIHPNGPVAVIGSSLPIHPTVLTLFGDAMASRLTTSDMTLGEVVRFAKTETMRTPGLLSRILDAVPALSRRIGIPHSIADLARREALQITLQGDATLPWRTSITASAVPSRPTSPFDPWAKFPRPAQPIAERITHLDAAAIEAPATPDIVDTRRLPATELATLLHLLDYVTYRLAAQLPLLGGWLPMPGTITIDRGVLTIPLRHAMTISSALLPESIRTLLFANGGPGEVRVTTPLRGIVRVAQQKLRLEQIEGLQVFSASAAVGHPIRAIEWDLTAGQRPVITRGPALIPQAVIDTANQRLAVYRTANGYQIHIAAAGPESLPYYTLMRPQHEGAAAARILLQPFNPTHDALLLPSAERADVVLLPLPFGWVANRVEAEGGGVRLQLSELTAGSKETTYLMIPLVAATTHGDLDTLLQIHGTALQTALHLSRPPTLVPIPASPDGLPLANLRVVATATMQGDADIVAGGTPLIPAPPTPVNTPAAPTPTHAEGPAFSLGGTMYWGAQVYLVLDTSGSMGALLPRLVKSLELALEHVPGMFRPFLEIGVLIEERGAARELLPLTAMTAAGMRQLRHACDTLTFRGVDQSTEAAVWKAHARFVEGPTDRLWRQIITITDTEGAAQAPHHSRVEHWSHITIDQGTIHVPPLGPIPLAAAHAATPLRDVLRGLGVAPPRIAEIDAVLGRLTPHRLDSGLQSEATALAEWATLLNRLSDPQRTTELVAALVPLLHTPVEQQTTPEWMVQWSVAAMSLLPESVAAPLLPAIEALLRSNARDLPIRLEAARSIGRLARAGHALAVTRLEQLARHPLAETPLAAFITAEYRAVVRQRGNDACAMTHWTHVQQDPFGTDPHIVADCGRSVTTVRTLLHQLQYGPANVRAAALEAIQQLLTPLDPHDQRPTEFRPMVGATFRTLLQRPSFRSYQSDAAAIAEVIRRLQLEPETGLVPPEAPHDPR
ncbi:MAG: hypothetical protein HY696_00405 [Deltaproteobacteria bacterium]|nr:hypothetical protein [Deltaproteobacteria bacterium]